MTARQTLSIALLLGLLAAAVLGGCGSSSGEVGSTHPDYAKALAGSPAALAALHKQANQLLPGEKSAYEKRIAALKGYPVVVNVWASWCGPCIEEMPELQRFAASQGRDGVQVLGIALDDAENVREFLRKIPVSYPIALDTPGPADAGVWLGNPKGVLPYSVLLSADGTVLKQRIGPFADGEIDVWARP